MIDYYQNKVECFSKTLSTVNNINQLLKELTEFNKDFQDSEFHNIFFQKLINNYSEFSKSDFKSFKRNLLTYLLLYIDFKWYHDYPEYMDDMFLNNNLDLLSLNNLKDNYQILFQYTTIKNGSLSRYHNSLRRRFDMLNNKPSGNTIGMRTPYIKIELLGLLNEISIIISSQYGRTIMIQVNSLIRTIEHQNQLLKIGYTYSTFSAHCKGYAIDIERKWYIMNDRPLFRIINNSLKIYAEKGIINLIDEGFVWHICLNPAYIETYQTEVEKWKYK